jgi:ParB family chromosome partitioning protein
MRAVSENVVRAPMATVDLWRAIESLASENWTEEAIASALAIPVRQIRKLRLLATVHPAILDQIGAGDMPRETDLRTIASASRDEQAAAWKKFKPKRGEGAVWWQMAQALDKTRFFARDAKFGEDERATFGIVWQEDLFAEGDEDSRFTIDGEAFVSAQRAWLDANLAKNGVILDVDQYGREKLPPRAQPTWTRPKKGDKIGFSIHPRDGTIHEIVFRIPESEAPNGKGRAFARGEDQTPAPKKTRPEITHKGEEIIGALRTEALVRSLEVNSCDDTALIGLLSLSLAARNVTIQTSGSTHTTRTKLVQSITEGGKLSQDADRLRIVARQMLASVLSCSLGHGDSGLVARIAGETLGADVHLPDMANEDFLGCLSKAGIEKVASGLGVLPRPRVKETRAEVIKRAQGGTFVHPAAHFALSEAEAALHLEPPRSYSWENDSDEPLDGDPLGEGDGASGAGVDDSDDSPEGESESDAVDEELPATAKARRSRRPQAEAARSDL